MFAVIKSGGKQYKVVLGTILKLEKVNVEKNSNIIFKEVLMFKNDTSYELGAPFLKNAEVKGKVLENKKDKKIIVFKKRRRHNSRRKNGHRQSLSVIQIEEILVNGKSFKSETPKKNLATKKSTNKDKVVQKEKTKSTANKTSQKKEIKKKG
jgi:large subunit ribosomal protein L21